jgi:rhomboid family protein
MTVAAILVVALRMRPAAAFGAAPLPGTPSNGGDGPSLLLQQQRWASHTIGGAGASPDSPYSSSMRIPPIRDLVARYTVATSFLALVAVGAIVTAVLTPRQVAALRLWSSTNVTNLEHRPVPALFLSAFVASVSPFVWLLIIAFAMFGANRVVGNRRLLVACATGQVLGTVVSEGIVAYRVDNGMLPTSFAHIVDIGPSYVVVSAIVVAAVLGSWRARAMSLAALAVLVFVGRIFAGVTSLQVAPVGHLTAMVVAVGLAVTLARRTAPVRFAHEHR